MKALLLTLSLALPFLAHADASLEKCYQRYGQVETEDRGSKKVHVYKDPAEVAAECNGKVVEKAGQEKSEAKVLELAGIIGRNSNWASAVPVYTAGAKSFSKTLCVHKDTLYALEEALARPADDKIAKDAADLMTACWPHSQKPLTALLKEDQNGYVKANVCAFLKAKKAVPSAKREICEN